MERKGPRLAPFLRCAAFLLPLLLAGCFHKTKQSQVQPLAPPIEDALPPKPAPAPTDLPPPVVTVPEQPRSPEANPQPQPAPKPAIKHKKAASTTQMASAGSPGVSAIGQLSSGAPSDLRRQTTNSIASTERAVNDLGRKLNDQEQKTAAQVREFLKQARAALASGDVDGAHTLAAKAEVLLGELRR